MYTKVINIEGYKTGHIQGIATDKERKYMYYSFTTCLIKTDMQGNVVGSVKGLAGHLGCIAYNYENGRVYGSLEYKHDSVGTKILKKQTSVADVEDGFYVAIFDVDKIDRLDMDAERDGIMTAVYLPEVLKDYYADGHKYGCSGIDGLTFAPIAGDVNGKKYLYVAYGIYGDVTRDDNDYQVILRYNIDNWKNYEGSLNQNDMHRNGPETPDSKYFLYTGNTRYGIQNLEYDEVTNCIFAAVYRGQKETFPNFHMYVIDMKKPVTNEKLKNSDECGEVLHLAEIGQRDEKTGIYGIDFPYGNTGIISLGDGYFYFSENYTQDLADGKAFGSNVRLYKFDGSTTFTEA